MRSPNTFYLSRLDHLRFFAAALVVVFHYFHHFVPNVAFNNPLASLVNEGHVGIGLFMVLSGFIFSVIAQGKNIHYGWFIYNRFIRIYPLYIFAVFLAVTLMVYNLDQTTRSVFDIFGWLLAFRPATIAEVPYFPHLWTIPVEFSFYLLFPFLHTFFTRYGVKHFVGILLLMFLVRAAVYAEYGSVRFLAYETLFGRLDQFLIGYLCGWLYTLGRGRQWLGFPPVLAAATALLLAVVWWLNQQGGAHNMTAGWWVVWPLVEGLAWAGVVMSYMYCRIPIPDAIDKGLSKLGEYSFSIYVVHMFVVVIVAKRIGLLGLSSNPAIDATLSALILGLPPTILVAALTHAVIEKPFLSFRKVYVRPDASAAKGERPPA